MTSVPVAFVLIFAVVQLCTAEKVVYGRKMTLDDNLSLNPKAMKSLLNPNRCHHPLITQLSQYPSINYPIFFKDASGTSGIDVRSACVNPVCDAFWHWNNTTFHVRGVVNGTYELVRERNGPFAGKKINRPVAKYDYCHRYHSYIT